MPKQGLFDRLMSANRESFDGGHYEAAFHALQAAMHVASDAGDERALHAAQQTATRQGASVDDKSPDHRMGTKYAKAHGGHSLFATAALHAQAMIDRLHGARVLAAAQMLRETMREERPVR